MWLGVSTRYMEWVSTGNNPTDGTTAAVMWLTINLGSYDGVTTTIAPSSLANSKLKKVDGVALQV